VTAMAGSGPQTPLGWTCGGGPSCCALPRRAHSSDHTQKAESRSGPGPDSRKGSHLLAVEESLPLPTSPKSEVS
jgi:hypothetical protein